jgi:preprotein translocase subunit SecF
MFVVRLRKLWFALSALLIALSLYGIFAYGFNFSIDFKGGTLTEVHYQGGRPAKEDIERSIGANDFGGFSVRPTGETGYIIRTRELTASEKGSLEASLSLSSLKGTIERQTTIGPTAGAELKSKAVTAVIVVIIMIVLFITFAFRKVSQTNVSKGARGISSWKYGFATIIALFHDVIIPAGVFVFLGHIAGMEIDLLFVTGLLAILGYSVHDTIVVFDRVRENLRINRDTGQTEEFDITVGKSVAQTFGRSINTSLTIFITLLALYIFGSTATREFSLLLLIGVVIGTYSSIFVASPLLVTFQKWQKK